MRKLLSLLIIILVAVIIVFLVFFDKDNVSPIAMIDDKKVDSSATVIVKETEKTEKMEEIEKGEEMKSKFGLPKKSRSHKCSY